MTALTPAKLARRIAAMPTRKVKGNLKKAADKLRAAGKIKPKQKGK